LTQVPRDIYVVKDHAPDMTYDDGIVVTDIEGHSGGLKNWVQNEDGVVQLDRSPAN